MQKEFTKPQLTRWEQGKKRQRLIIWSVVGLILVVILGLVGVFIWKEVAPIYKTIIEVNGQKIKMSQYVSTLKVFLKDVSEEYYSSYASYTKSVLEQSEIIRQGAAEYNINVTDDEVTAQLTDSGLEKGYAPLMQAQMLTDKLKEEYFKLDLEKTAAQKNIEVMFLESETQAAEIRARIEAGESFNDLAEANSLDSYSKNNKGEIGWHVREAFSELLGSSVPGDYAFAESTQNGQLSQPRPESEKSKQVGYWLISLIEKGSGDVEGQVNVRAMLLGSEEEATRIRTDIIENGADFFTIANEKSQYDSGGKNGGLIGFINKGMMSSFFDEAAFALEVGEISLPVKDTTQFTTGGAWLIKVLESDVEKEISSDDMTILVDKLFEVWFLQKQAEAVLIDHLDSESQAWAIRKATGK